MKIIKQLKSYSNKIYPMHMPGHKLGRLGAIDDMYCIDVTEVEGTDNLHRPVAMLKDAQEKAAKTFGGDKTYFLVNGSTVGLMAAITALCKPKDSLIIARNSHRSVYDALITTGINPVYIYPEIHSNGIIGGINPTKVVRLLDRHKDVKGVVITSPTYDGIISDIKSIAKIVHDRDKILIVDEAHGAHLYFIRLFPHGALYSGADVVIQSTHKTLPSLTQSGMMHIKGNRLDYDRIQRTLALYETSSPSYVLMASLDNCRQVLDKKATVLFEELYNNLVNLRIKLQNLKHLKLIDNDIIGTSSIYDLDISKLLIHSGYSNSTGVEIDKLLRYKYGIQVEMSNPYYLLALTSIADTKKGFDQLCEALKEIDGQLKKKKYQVDTMNKIKPKIILSPREAFFSNTIGCSDYKDKDMLGAISGSYIIPYPPGIPFVVPGEEITKEIIDQIDMLHKQGVEIIGIDNIKIIQKEV